MEKEFVLPLKELGPHLGGEIEDMDVREIGTTIPLEDIKEALFQRQLLCFRDQRLEPENLSNFTKLFGKPLPHVLQQFSLPGYPEIYVLSNIVENGEPIGNTREGFGWHTDLAYMAQPAAYTILYGIEVPKVNGDTLFASLYCMWDNMEATMKSRLRKLQGHYSYKHLYNQRPNVEPLTTDQEAQTPDVYHPFSRLHPETGREGLYIGGDDFIAVDGSDDPARDYTEIWQLFKETSNKFCYHHQWKVGDLLIWDNRGLIHTATDYDTENERRLVWRTSVVGEMPIPSE